MSLKNESISGYDWLRIFEVEFLGVVCLCHQFYGAVALELGRLRQAKSAGMVPTSHINLPHVLSPVRQTQTPTRDNVTRRDTTATRKSRTQRFSQRNSDAISHGHRRRHHRRGILVRCNHRSRGRSAASRRRPSAMLPCTVTPSENMTITPRPPSLSSPNTAALG